MVQKMKKIFKQEAVPAIGFHRPVPSGAASFLKTFGNLKWFIKRFEVLIWEDLLLDMSIRTYRLRPGQWIGKRVSDDIWPIDFEKPYKKPFSDYQISVLDRLIEKRKAFQAHVEAML